MAGDGSQSRPAFAGQPTRAIAGAPADTPSLAAVIVAAGSSRRMGFDKILTPLAGEALLRHSVRAFEICADVAEIVVVCAREREADVRAILTDVRKLSAVVAGGASRQESVSNGLCAVKADFAAVHDGARPLVSATLISRCFEAAVAQGAAVAAEPVTDTLQRADAGGACAEVVSRDGLWRMQTPQVFRTRDIRAALRKACDDGETVTDETSAIQRAGGRVFLVENTEWNFKVTFPRDLAVAEFLLQSRAAASLT